MFEKGYQKDYEFFANIYSKLLVKIYEKIEVIKIARNSLIILNNLLRMHLKLLQKSNSKNKKKIGDLIGNKITKVSRSLPQNSSETIFK